MKDFELRDGEIVLRPIKLEYAEAHLAGDDEENVRWLSGGVSIIETVRRWILRMTEAWENDRPIYCFIIFEVKTNRQVGMVDGNSDPALVEGLAEGEVNISYNIYPIARGNGYATKAVNLLLPFLKEKGYKAALIRVNPGNKKSLGVAGRVGFSRLGETTTEHDGSLVVFKKSLIRNVAVLPYDENWPGEFEKIKNELAAALSDSVISIEHVGSTSVPGLAAKPIIDIDIVVEENLFEKVKNMLAETGYVHVGDQGIVGREVFDYSGKNHLMAHHLYVCGKNSSELKRHLTFRNHLRSHPEDRDRYGEIKREMARKFPHDIDGYMAGKHPLIQEIYRKCGL